MALNMLGLAFTVIKSQVAYGDLWWDRENHTCRHLLVLPFPLQGADLQQPQQMLERLVIGGKV